MIKEKLSIQHKSAFVEYGVEDIYSTNLWLFKYKSGEFICLQGNTLDYIFIFLKGKAKVFFTSPNGKTLLMAFYTKRGLIGDSELIGDKKVTTSSVQAITDVQCIGIPLIMYKDYLKNNLKFMNMVGLELANKLHDNTISNAFNILHPLDSRLCAYILMTNKDGCFKEKLTELSEIMGTSYRHLLRTLERLCNEGLLEKAKQGYMIVDKIELQKRAGGNY